MPRPGRSCPTTQPSSNTRRTTSGMSSARRHNSKQRESEPREDAVAGRAIWITVQRMSGESVSLSVAASTKSLKLIQRRLAVELKVEAASIEQILSCNLALVESGEHLRDGGQYIVVCAGETIDFEALPSSFRYVRKGTNFHVDIDKVRTFFPHVGERQLETFLLKFNIFDEDGDGLVGTFDVIPLIESVGITARKEDIESALEKTGLDHKPKFDFYEFLAVTKHLGDRRGSSRRNRSALCTIQ